MAHQRFDYSQNSTYLLRHSSWIYRYHRTSRSSSLHRSAGADTACIYRKGSSSRIGLTRDHYFLPPTSRRSHIPISLHVVQMKTTWSLAERTANRKEPCLRVSTHRCCPHLSQTPAAPSIRALRILRSISCLSSSSSSCILAYIHTPGLLGPGTGRRRFLYITIC